jgi:spermidine/putrescine transport system permease protein
MATVITASDAPPVQAPRRRRHRFGHWSFISIPTALLVVFFLAPMVLMIQMALLRFPPSTSSGYTWSHFTTVLTEPIYRHIAVTTFEIATGSQLLMLLFGFPLAYVMAFRAGRWELPLLLLLVLADELNPIIKIYAWRMLLGREGLINDALTRIGVMSHPVSWLLFDKFAVIVTLTFSWITYTTIPIYASMKAINPAVFEAATDLGASWWTKFRRIVLPLSAPGLFIALILVYIPLFTDFVTPSLVGGTGTYMLGQAVQDLILSTNNWGDGSALNFVLLVLSVLAAFVAYRLAKINQIEA